MLASDIAVVLEGQVSSPSLRRVPGGMQAAASCLAKYLTNAHPESRLPTPAALSQLMKACIQVNEELNYSAGQVHHTALLEATHATEQRHDELELTPHFNTERDMPCAA